jgi:hypothetical protein
MVLVQAMVPAWVRDSLRHEAAKERRSVSNLLCKWLMESCERLPEGVENEPPAAPTKPVQLAEPGPVIDIPSEPQRSRHAPNRPLTDMPAEEEPDFAQSSY